MASTVQAIQPIIEQIGTMLDQQATGAAKAIKLAGPNKTLGDYMKAAKGDAGKQAPVHEINNTMNSLQLIVDPKRSTVTVQKKGGNSLVDQIDTIQKSPEFKELAKAKETKEYYGYLQAPLLESARKMSEYSQAIFVARAGKPKDIEAAAKKYLTKAVTSLVKAKKYASDPHRAQLLATQAGILKGLIEASNVQSVVKSYPNLDKELQPLFTKLGVDDVYQQAAQKIINEAKQAEQPTEGQQRGGLPGGQRSPFELPQRRAA